MIVGEQTRLRAIEREEIPTYVRWFNDPEVRQYLEMYLPMSVAEEEQWFEAHLKDDTSRIFGIETEEGRLIGNIGLHNLDWKNRNAELGIVIAEKEYWGRGYGTDAVKTLLDFAFNEMNLHRVSLSVYEFNERAVRCYEKCGFRHEGRAREALFRDGSYHDHLLMAILRKEFISEDQSSA
jgi:UDP-4-amino-4,6-dideoxy-N-acetyl-beta-L-altrosamine N-acetyltransferase